MEHILVDGLQVIPSKIVCVGRNYTAHVKELKNTIPDEPVIFLKPNSAICSILQADHAGAALHYEGELCFIYDGTRLSAVGFGLDITKRDLQTELKEKGLPWEKAKAFDGSAVFSPFVSIDTLSEHLSLELYINGTLTQEGHLDQMMFKPDQILAFLSCFLTLYPGDVVMTGTPKGVGPIMNGDLFYAKILDRETVLTQGEWQAISK